MVGVQRNVPYSKPLDPITALMCLSFGWISLYMLILCISEVDDLLGFRLGAFR